MVSGKSQFRVGDSVMHKKLGKGDVLDIYPLGEDTIAIISFEKSGQKKIVLKYANLELVSRPKTEAEGKEEKAERESKKGRAAEAEEEADEEAEEDGKGPVEAELEEGDGEEDES
jgi:hypothetical protein